MKNFLFSISLLVFSSLSAQTYEGIKLLEKIDQPFPIHVYQLKNGMKIYAAQTKGDLVHAQLIVNAGYSSVDFDDQGLVDMVRLLSYNGTKNLGTYSVNQEKPILEHLNGLYENKAKFGHTKAGSKIDETLDKIALRVSEYGIPDEVQYLYDLAGIKETSYSEQEYTMFDASIPRAQFEKWMMLQGERLTNPSFRYMQQTLQTANNYWRSVPKAAHLERQIISFGFEATRHSNLYPIPDSGSLRIPHIRVIDRFFETQYQPSNMALIVTGDMDPYDVAVFAMQYTGHLSGKKNDSPKAVPIPPIPEDRETLLPSYRNAAHYLFRGTSDTGIKDEYWYLVLLEKLFDQRLKEKASQNSTLYTAGAKMTLYTHYQLFDLWALTATRDNMKGSQFLLDQIKDLKASGFTYLEVEQARKKVINEFSYLLRNNTNEWLMHIYQHNLPADKTAGLKNFLMDVNADSLNQYLQKILIKNLRYAREDYDASFFTGTAPVFKLSGVKDNTDKQSYFANKYIYKEVPKIEPVARLSKTFAEAKGTTPGVSWYEYAGDITVKLVYPAGTYEHAHLAYLPAYFEVYGLNTMSKDGLPYLLNQEVTVSAYQTTFTYVFSKDAGDKWMSWIQNLPSTFRIDQGRLTTAVTDVPVDDAFFSEFSSEMQKLLGSAYTVEIMSDKEPSSIADLKLVTENQKESKVKELKDKSVVTHSTVNAASMTLDFPVYKVEPKDLANYYVVYYHLFGAHHGLLYRKLHISEGLAGEANTAFLQPSTEKSPVNMVFSAPINGTRKDEIIKLTDSLLSRDSINLLNFELLKDEIKSQLNAMSVKMSITEKNRLKAIYKTNEDVFVMVIRELDKITPESLQKFYSKKIKGKPYLLSLYLRAN